MTQPLWLSRRPCSDRSLQAMNQADFDKLKKATTPHLP